MIVMQGTGEADRVVGDYRVVLIESRGLGVKIGDDGGWERGAVRAGCGRVKRATRGVMAAVVHGSWRAHAWRLWLQGVCTGDK